MARTTQTKKRILTPKEIELAEKLSQALIMQGTGRLMVREGGRQIGTLTREINKLGFKRATPVWMEAREMQYNAAATGGKA